MFRKLLTSLALVLLHVPPALAALDSGYCALPYSEVSGDVNLNSSLGQFGPDPSDFFIVELGEPVFFSVARSSGIRSACGVYGSRVTPATFRDFVQVVVHVGADKEMPRANASRSVAPMTDNLAIRDGTVCYLPCVPMSHDATAVKTELPIAVLVSPSKPHPAFIGTDHGHLGPKSLYVGKPLDSHLISYSSRCVNEA